MRQKGHCGVGSTQVWHCPHPFFSKDLCCTPFIPRALCSPSERGKRKQEKLRSQTTPFQNPKNLAPYLGAHPPPWGITSPAVGLLVPREAILHLEHPKTSMLPTAARKRAQHASSQVRPMPDGYQMCPETEGEDGDSCVRCSSDSGQGERSPCHLAAVTSVADGSLSGTRARHR